MKGSAEATPLKTRRAAARSYTKARTTMFRSPRRLVLAGLGLLCVGLGLAGVVLPGLPTTVFLIAASYLFTRSSPALNERVRRIRLLRPYLHHLEGHGPMPIKAKLSSLALMWAAVTTSLVVLTLRGGLEPWLAAVIVSAALIGSLVIVRYRTFSPRVQEKAAGDSSAHPTPHSHHHRE